MNTWQTHRAQYSDREPLSSYKRLFAKWRAECAMKAHTAADGMAGLAVISNWSKVLLGHASEAAGTKWN